MKNISVIIPSLDPNERLLNVVNNIKNQGFTDIILVDDGSQEENKKFFPSGDGITLLVHEKNRGKGAALKTAIKYVIENRPESKGVISCDGDGQHLAEDVKKVCDEMVASNKFVLGVRDFSADDVPAKSRIGNRLSSLALAICCGSYISDTQTGLRAIPAHLLEEMAEIEGDRFEYETNVLLGLRKMNAEYCEVKIETVYLDENKGTHFHPIKDTARIFSRILKYLFSSLACFLIDIGLFALFSIVFKLNIPISTVSARVISSITNFTINKKVVFKSGEPVVSSAVKYFALTALIMLLSAGSVTVLSMLFNIDDNSPITTLIKTAVDIILCIISYTVQKKWIFKQK